MHHSNVQKLFLTWLVLIGGGLFMLTALPGLLLTLAIPLFRWQELSFFTILFMTLSICILVVVIWGMKWAWRAIKTPVPLDADLTTVSPEEPLLPRKKPIWPWLVILPAFSA